MWLVVGWYVVSVDAVRRLLAKLLNAAEEEVLLECGYGAVVLHACLGC